MSNERLSFRSSDNGRRTSLHAETVYLSESRYDKEWKSRLHSHPNAEIILITSGVGKFILEDDTLHLSEGIPLSRGDLVVINPFVSHTETSDESNPLSYITLGLNDVVFRIQRKQEGDDQEILSDETAGVFNVAYDFDDMVRYLRMLQSELRNREDYHETAIHSLANLFLIHVMRRVAIVSSHKPSSQKEHNFAVIQRYIDTHYAMNLTLDDLSNKFFINKFHLIHIFKKNIGISPVNYLLQKRLDEAKSLLLKSDHSISSICQEVGFANPNHFTQLFKKNETLTPTAYRRQFREST